MGASWAWAEKVATGKASSAASAMDLENDMAASIDL
jgi:hypothetical protein